MTPVPFQLPAASRRGLRIPNSLRLGALVLLICTPLFARNPQPVTRISLEPLGYQPLAVRYLLASSTMLTLHYVDDNHLLLTFNARRLLNRIPGDPPIDQDRSVDALLLDLPSGHVLAKVEWRLHDHDQYLWSLGHGQFLLRIHGTLTTIAPLANLDSLDPFAQRPFLRTNRRIVALRLSPASEFLTVETIQLPSLIEDPSGAAASLDSLSPPLPKEVQINFYRLAPPVPGREFIQPRSAGMVVVQRALDLPINGAGLLHVLDEGHSSWGFDFKSFTGKVLRLGLYDSTCRPYPAFVSVSEFITFGCHGGSSGQQLAAFNLRGDQMWEQTLIGSYLAPSMVYAPDEGRFALGRLIISSAAVDSESLTPAEVTSQSVDVFQINSGKPLLHVECTPTARAGQNFAFSPNGLNFAIVHEDAIEIYTLPALTDQDRAAVKLATTSAPEPNEAPVDLTTSTPKLFKKKQQSDSANTAEDSQPIPAPIDADQPSPPAAVQATPQAVQSQPSETPSGDPPGDQPRKPPTLYNPAESKPQ